MKTLHNRGSNHVTFANESLESILFLAFSTQICVLSLWNHGFVSEPPKTQSDECLSIAIISPSARIGADAVISGWVSGANWMILRSTS